MLIKKPLSGNQLKLIAVVSMLIDHMGYLLVGKGLVVPLSAAGEPYAGWWMLYRVMRCLGRVAFPIYAFMLVEGFVHTRNRRNYGLRLGLLALLSEIPFDLFQRQTLWDWQMQNVFVTLLLGLGMLQMLEWIPRSGLAARLSAQVSSMAGEFSMQLHLILQLLVIGGFCGLAWLARCDYDYVGIMLIALLWWCRNNRSQQCILGFLWMILAMSKLSYVPGYAAAFALLYCYSGKRGSWNGKWFFYLFYPVHQLVLYLVYRGAF